jgi:hypothetical protein
LYNLKFYWNRFIFLGWLIIFAFVGENTNKVHRAKGSMLVKTPTLAGDRTAGLRMKRPILLA